MLFGGTGRWEEHVPDAPINSLNKKTYIINTFNHGQRLIEKTNCRTREETQGG